MTGTNEPRLSVIVPVYNGGEAFRLCLAALESDSEPIEIVVVDDGSTDRSAEVAEACGARLLTTSGREGPAAARNLGASVARAPLLLFVDADCEVLPGSVGGLIEAFDSRPEVDAIFGSYDDRPAHTSIVSRYRNLQHHWVHQQNAGPAQTFWAGFGGIRAAAFSDVGGFDTQRYARPCIEDIELGYRLNDRGHRVELIPDLKVRHHKRWTLRNMVTTDLFDRAVPWTRLRLESQSESRELNLDGRGQASIALVAILLVLLAGAFVEPRLLLAALLALATLCIVQAPLYSFLFRTGGLRLMIAGIPLHIVHLTCAGLGYVMGRLQHLFSKPGSRAA